MGYTSQGDQVEMLTAVLWRIHLRLGLFAVVRCDPWRDPGRSIGLLAKRCGTTVAEVESWLTGQSVPPSGAALRAMFALPGLSAVEVDEPAPELNGVKR